MPKPNDSNEMNARDQQQWSTIVNSLKAFRRDVDTAEARLFREAYKIETTRDRLWKQIYATFDACLENLHICDSRRYRNFLAAEGLLGPRQVDAIGVPSALQATKIADPQRQQKFVEAAAKRKIDDGVPWSDQQAVTMRKTIAGQAPKDSTYNKRVDREARQNGEIVELRRENQDLRRQLKEKDEEIARLQKTISGKRRSSGQQAHA